MYAKRLNLVRFQRIGFYLLLEKKSVSFQFGNVLFYFGDFLRGKVYNRAALVLHFKIKRSILIALVQTAAARVVYVIKIFKIENVYHIGLYLMSFADEGAYHSEREFMSEQTAKKAIDFLIEKSGNRKVLEVDFFGGEPLMCLQTIKNVVAYAREKGGKAGKKFLFTTTTNALLLDDDAIDFFNREMENVVLSLDGRREVHDAIRKTKNGKGSFDYVINNIKKFVRSRGDKSYYVRGTFTAKNLDFSNDVIFLAENGFDSISMEPVVTDIDDLAIKAEHLPRILDEYEILCDKYLDKYEKGEGFNFFHFNIDLEGGVCLQKKVSACGAGNEYFSVVPNGDIYPCHQFAGDKNFLMGNVYDGALDGQIREKFASNCLFTRKDCEGCFAKFICSGGCSANNYHFAGDMNKPYGITCDMMKKRIECGMHVLARKKAGKR